MKKLLVMCAFTAAVLTGCSDSPKTAGTADGNPVIETIMARRSVRAYQDIAVEREKLQTIAECGVNAPNAMNAQNWEVRIVDDKEFLDGINALINESNPQMAQRSPKGIFFGAPAIICVAIKADANPFVEIDAGLMGENMMLAAQSLGLGTVCLGGPVGTIRSATEYYNRLGFSPEYTLSYVLAVGYPAESPDAKPRDLNKIRFVE